MAVIVEVLRLEDDLVVDACNELKAITSALPKRHGDRFRVLERRLQALSQNIGEPSLERLIDSLIFVVVPPPEWMAIIREARELGVI